MKHAYLIIVHNEFTLLQYLIKALDDELNDIFIHFDKKVLDIPELTVKKAGLFLTKERIDVRWGDISVVEAEYALFAEAVNQGSYHYYHLLSGVDIPLKGQDEIHRFFDAYQGKEFIGFSQYDYTKEIERKVHRYHLFPKYFKQQAGISGLFKKTMRFLFICLQDLVGYKRYKKMDFKKGTQWVSVTHGFVSMLLLKREEVMQLYHHTFCPDEIYKQTLCGHSEFREKLYDMQDEGKGCMRAIGWKDGELRDWTLADYDKLMQSGALFARKFNTTDIAVVEIIANVIRGKEGGEA
ncbi:beta-1,6-N-acetylglucosaminyltransferase [Sphingobacterium gobiense]|uniref:Peptide O-xylosyltransferase n=1 Tax=Sphingobacterium gobiense TaxID=1382456 RepID=A0A2S9JT68_9SPHI|nr:beta-1,6-N-acetylglucosaminyltransferase [Sphingobacterium gobiense]PRD56486.1 glycosyl transferase [Sphingobacterium gobiense]